MCKMEAWKKFISSFDNTSNGFSGRKLSAFAGVCMALYITIINVDSSNVIEAITVWLAFSLLCLGIVTVEQIIRFKEGIDREPIKTTTTETVTKETEIKAG